MSPGPTPSEQRRESASVSPVPGRGSEGKILPLESAVEACREARRDGRTVAQCHGCFDLVHPGHVRHLKEAAAQADVLLVSITPDPAVDKGDGRPLFPEELRAENLAALSFVDLVCVNTEPTAVGLLTRTRPDVYVKGREYETNNDQRFAAERRAVESHGGRVVFTSGDLVFSSTALIGALATETRGAIERDPQDAALQSLRSRHPLASDDLLPVIDRMSGRRVLVVGETIVDTYTFCDHPEVASEAPCLTLRPLERTSFDGGAAVIALHAAALGAQATLVTAMPKTAQARAVTERLELAGVEVRPVHTEHPLIEKERLLVGDEKVLKLDRVRRITLDTDERTRLLDELLAASDGGVDAAILADYGCGLLTPRTLRDCVEALRPNARVLAGDVSGRRASLTSLRSMDLVTPTERELRDAVQDYDSSLNAVVWKLMERTGNESVITTLGGEGLIAFSRLPDADGQGWRARVAGEHVPSLDPRPIDTLGCGDALLAVSALALACGGTRVQSAYLGAIAAAGESARLGNHPVNKSDLERRVRAASTPTLRIATRAHATQNALGMR